MATAEGLGAGVRHDRDRPGHRRADPVSGPRISDRALLCFLQRAGGMDIEGVRAAMSASLARCHEAAKRLGGGGHLIVSGGMTYVVRGEVVATVVHRRDAGVDARLLDGPDR